MSGGSQSRTPRIPIPRHRSTYASARSLEDLIQIPLPSTSPVASANPSASAISARSSSDRRTSSAYYSSSRNNTTPSRAATLSSVAAPQSPMSLAAAAAARPTRIEPRVIRADPTTCAVASTSLSPTRTRKPSGVGTRSAGIAGSSSGAPLSSFVNQPPWTSTTIPQATFPRPAYLDHSALRHMLRPTSPSHAPVSRVDHSALEVEPSSTVRRPPSPADSEDSSMSSLSRDQNAPRHISVSNDASFNLPTRWSEKIRHHHLTLSGHDRDLTFEGASCHGDREAASARTNHPIPRACGVYYYEVKIIHTGQPGHISIGFAGPDVKTSRLPGWEQNSWGYHADDGRSFAADKLGTPYGPPFGDGDVIGCGIDFSVNRAFYTRNGTLLGLVFENIGKTINLYPSVGLRHQGESIRANFGQEPFVYNIDYYVRKQRKATWDRFMGMPINAGCLNIPQTVDVEDTKVSKDVSSPLPASDEQTRAFLNKLISSYLSHHGYSNTLKAFEKQQQTKGPAVVDGDVDMDTVVKVEEGTIRPDQEIEIRTRLVKSVVAGDIDSAIQGTEVHYPGALSADDGFMMFKLRCRKFVELLLEAAEIQKRLREPSFSNTLGRNDDGHNGGLLDGPMDGVDDEDQVDGMDVDGGSDSAATILAGGGSASRVSLRPPPSRPSQHDAALQDAITYGQHLKTLYSEDPRREVRTTYHKTIGMIAYADPLSDGSVQSAEFVGHASRVALANELNQAILKSLGRPPSPPLETLYRHTASCVTQLGVLGVGAAAFADMPRELLES